MIDGGDAMMRRPDLHRRHCASVIALAVVGGLLTLPGGVAAQGNDATPVPEIQRTMPATETEGAKRPARRTKAVYGRATC
jgi:hypothetical protein